MAYTPKTKPFKHQQEHLDKYKNKRYHAIFDEQGTGKTKCLIDTAGHLYTEGHVNFLLVLAPNGVHANWVVKELPAHMGVEYESRTYHNGMGVKWERDLVDFLNTESHKGKLKVLTMPIEGLYPAKKAKIVFEKVLKDYECFVVIDESDTIGNPTAKRTKYLLKHSKGMAARRIASGTPSDSKPLALWSQMGFLSPDIFKQDYYSFRSRYGIIKDKVVDIGGKAIVQKFVVGYRHLEDLKNKVAPYSSRNLKADCLDLPKKMYKTIPLLMSKEQKRYYKDMLERCFYVIENENPEDGLVYAKNALDMMGKLARITGGFAEKGVQIKDNPKLKWVRDNIDLYTSTKDVIIWARYIDELKALQSLLGEENCALVYGAVKGKEREAEVLRFQQDDNCKVLVANTTTMGAGYTLTNASTEIYYSNDFSLRNRRQSEDRTHRAGQEDDCLYIDLTCTGTIDELTLQKLKAKKDVADMVLGDPKTAWVELSNFKY